MSLLAACSVSAAALSACTSAEKSSDIDTATMGDATAAVSPASANPAGEVIPLDSDIAQVTDMERAGDTLALRSGGKLQIGTVEQFRSKAATTLDIDGQCGDMTATGSTFVLACPNAVYLIDKDAPSMDNKVSSDRNLSTAVQTTSGEIVAGVKDEATVVVIKDGKETKDFSVEDPTDEMVAVPVDGKPDAIVRINRKYTIIQDVKWADGKQGAILRMGKGVGQISPAEKGMVVASDTIGNQIGLYFADDVIRLQKTMTVPESPWAVAWDHKNTLAWIASTKENQIVGYDPSQGNLDEKTRYQSVADVHNMTVLDDGTIVAASATGAGLEVIPSA